MNQPPLGDGQRALAAERVLDLLRGRRPPAALVMELAALVGGPLPAASADLDGALTQLDANQAIVLMDHSAPDPHLEGLDLRAVALVPDEAPVEQAVEAARRAADAVWGEWLRQFLATHRCT